MRTESWSRAHNVVVRRPHPCDCESFHLISFHSVQVAPESQLSVLRSCLSAPFELARQHCSYACLFFICKQLNDMGMLMSLMVGRVGREGKGIEGGSEGRREWVRV